MENKNINWEALLEQCKKDAAAHKAAEEWFLTVYLNITEMEQMEYVQNL